MLKKIIWSKMAGANEMPLAFVPNNCLAKIYKLQGKVLITSSSKSQPTQDPIRIFSSRYRIYRRQTSKSGVLVFSAFRHNFSEEGKNSIIRHTAIPIPYSGLTLKQTATYTVQQPGTQPRFVNTPTYFC